MPRLKTTRRSPKKWNPQNETYGHPNLRSMLINMYLPNILRIKTFVNLILIDENYIFPRETQN